MRRITLFLLGIVLMSTAACGRTNSNANSDRVTATEDSKVIHLTKAEFLEKVYNFEKNPDEWKYEGDKPAIVDFYATWCGPCKMVAPILDELAKEYDGQIVIYKVDTDKEAELASVFGIRSIPSILFIPMSGKPEMAQGALPKEAFKKAIDEFLLKNKYFCAIAVQKNKIWIHYVKSETSIGLLHCLKHDLKRRITFV